MTSRAAYDAWHSQHAVDEESDAPWHRVLKPLLALRDKRVLEIGCGRGGFASWLGTRPDGEAPARVVAADFSPEAVRMARDFGASRGVRGVEYAVGDLTSLGFATASFDVAISCETIEHVPDSRRALEELARVVRPGGTLYLTCPNYLNLMGAYRIYLRLRGRRYTEAGQPINHPLVAHGVSRWLRAVGFEPNVFRGVGHYLPFPGRPPIRFETLDRGGALRWLAHHSVFVATRAAR